MENILHAFSLDKTDPQRFLLEPPMTEFRQPIQVQSSLETPGILVQLGHIQRI